MDTREEPEPEETTFVTDDKRIRESGKLDESDRQILEEAKTGEGIRIISSEQLMALAKAASDAFEYYREQCKKRMTRKHAWFIRSLRIDEGYSWRAVARRCHDNRRFKSWPKWEPPSSQPMGMALCEKAAEFFGEDYKKEPWN